MESTQFTLSMAVGAAIGAVLVAMLFCYLLAFEPGGFRVADEAAHRMIVIGLFLGALLGKVFSRYRPH